MTTTAPPTAQSSYGALLGTVDRNILVFRGMPFARPPVGPLRWRAPERPAPWSGVRDATRFGPAPIQAREVSGHAQMFGFRFDEFSEDCLYLNVWTPGRDGRRPVLVFIHGGAFVFGAGSLALFDGVPLATRGDVVVVTLNYRLGAFGFLRGKGIAGAELDATGNEGLLDQLAALRWVREEIAAFGGAPDNITVFGESAGAVSIAALLTMPAARGLFHKAILQSGSLNLLTTPDAAGAVTRALLAELAKSAEGPGQLPEVPAARLLAAQLRVQERVAGMAFAPVADGEIVPSAPFDAIAAGASRGVPVLIGTNRDEGAPFTMQEPSPNRLDDEQLRRRLMAMVGAEAAAEVIATYRREREARGELATPSDLWCDFLGDRMFRVGALRLAEWHARQTPATFAYRFDWRSPVLGGILGAAHGHEQPFVFGTLDTCGAGAALGPITNEMRRLSAVMQDAWIAFAHTGNPAVPGLPAWEPYSAPRRATMLLDTTPALVDAPHEAERALWDRIDGGPRLG